MGPPYHELEGCGIPFLLDECQKIAEAMRTMKGSSILTIREERTEKQRQRLERKMALAQRDNMGIVSRKTLDSSDFIRLFGPWTSC